MTTDSSDQPEPLPFADRITKYDPADRDRSGCYLGSEDVVSDDGPVERCTWKQSRPSPTAPASTTWPT